jgi:Serine phosphatase RsbU, regulator of sigma subunit
VHDDQPAGDEYPAGRETSETARPLGLGGADPSAWHPRGRGVTRAARAFRRAMAGTPVGCWEWDLRAGTLAVDDQALEILGIDPAGFEAHPERWMDVVHPDDRTPMLARKDEAVHDRGLFGAEFRVLLPGGGQRWVRVVGHVVPDEHGEPACLVGALDRVPITQVTIESVRNVLRHMGHGFLAVDENWRITFLNASAERLLGTSGAGPGVSLWDLLPGELSDLEQCLRHARAEEMPADIEVRWPGTGRWYRLCVAPEPGAFTILITDIHDRRKAERERHRAERAAAARTARLGELTLALADALTVSDVVDTMARHVLSPFGASGMQIWVIEGGRPVVVGSVGYPDEFTEQLSELYAQRSDILLEPIRARRPVFVEHADEFAEQYPKMATIPERSGMRSWAFLPLVASGQELGAAIVAFDRQHHFRSEERDLLIALCGLAAQALERARLYDAAHARARQLQRGLLPRELPDLPAVVTAARYMPAGREMEVGGDWYDVIALSASRVALVIGDVMGHGVSEAATMGRLRTAVRTLADLELPPDELLTHLNDLVSEMGENFFATCLYMVYDPTDRSCVFSLAGHPPPAIALPGGTVLFPVTEPDPPLGAAAPPFTQVRMRLPEHSVVVLYTDGLVESADQDIEVGMERLAGALTRSLGRHRRRLWQAADEAGTGRRGGCPQEVCDDIADAVMGEEADRADDAALLVACTHVLPPGDVVRWRLPEDAVAAGLARRYAREQLTAWGLEPLVMTTELLVSELVGNVVRHAKGPIHLRLLRSNVLTCEVSDGSLTTPRIRRTGHLDEGGRGLQLVAALSHRWGTRFTASGKSIWVEQTLPGS